jgi:uncharacterized membrane protein YgcG
MLKSKEEGEYAVDCKEKTKVNKTNVPLVALIISLIMLAQLIGGIGCLVRKSESVPLIGTAREAVNARIKWLDEQKFEGPDPLAPLEVNVDSVESEKSRIGRDGDVHVGLSGGAGINIGGGGGIGIGAGVDGGGGIGGGGGGG